MKMPGLGRPDGAIEDSVKTMDMDLEWDPAGGNVNWFAEVRGV